MNTVRSRLGLLLGVCYLWVLLFPLIAVCPCHGIPAFESETEVDESVSCLFKESAPCCSRESTNQDRAAGEHDSPDSRCSGTADCFDCPACLSQNIVWVTSETMREVAVSDVSVSTPGGIAELVLHDRTVLPERPPLRSKLPVHISTTVLRC